MSEYNGKVYREQGSDALVIRAADGGVVKGQASAGGTPAQAAAISDISVTGNYATDDTPIETAINSILAAIRNAGIVASS